MLALTQSLDAGLVGGMGNGRMLELALLRHAKSGVGDSGVRDFDRPLSGRGRKAAGRMGEHLRDRGFVPDRILCSPARRARNTVECLGESFVESPGLEFPQDFYLATPETLLTEIASAGDARRVLVIAHNPGLEDLAKELAGRGAGSTGALTAFTAGFASAALAVFEVDGEDFAGIRHEGARLMHFTTPRDLD